MKTGLPQVFLMPGMGQIFQQRFLGRPSAHHSSQGSSKTADSHNDHSAPCIHGGVKIKDPGSSKKNQKIGQTRKQAPEKAALVDPFPGCQTSGKASDEIDPVYHEIHDPFSQLQLIERKSQGCQQGRRQPM